LRELFVGLRIRLYARLSPRGFDIIPALLPELISDPKETEGENTDIFNFCFFSSFPAARQPF
jgi:hypothetical protein